MKTWISNWRASMRLDQPASSGTQPCCGSIHDVHQRLRHARPHREPPDHLHFSIMQKVRQNSARRVDRTVLQGRSRTMLRWAGVVTASTLCGVVLFLAATSSRELSAPGDISVQWSEQAAEGLQVVGALDQELQHLDQDLRAAAEHLLACLP